MAKQQKKKGNKIEVVGEAFRVVWKDRWIRLSIAGFSNDHAIAKLANDIRKEFPKDEAGDEPFKEYVRGNLRGASGLGMLRRAAAFRIFSKAEWNRLGGWAGISFISALKDKERLKLLASLTAGIAHHYSTIRSRAAALNIYSSRHGRGSHGRSEVRVAKLQAFVVSLYKSGIKGLPVIPKDVASQLNARSRSKLAAVGAVAGRQAN